MRLSFVAAGNFQPVVCLFVCASLFGAGITRAEPPSRKQSPLNGFGNTSLDRPGSSGGSSLDQRPGGLTPPPSAAFQPNLTSTSFQGLNFEARTVSSGGRSTVEFAGDGKRQNVVSKSVARESQPVLEVTVRNVSRSAGKAHFDWFFAAKAVSGGEPFVWDKGERDVDLAGGTQRIETIESKALVREMKTETHNEYVNRPVPGRTTTRVLTPVTSQTKTGAQPYGWIVRMFVDGTLAKVRASSSVLETVGRNPEQMAILLKRAPAG